jgi:hypothetical protein
MKTIQQLIDELSQVEDKSQEIMVYGHSSIFPVISVDEDCEGVYINIE